MTWAKPRTSGVWMPKLPGAPVQCWQTSHCPTPPCERACRRPEMSGLHTEIYTAYQPNPTKKDRIKPFEDVWPTIVMHNWQGQVRGDFNHDWDFHLVMTSVTLPVIALCLLVWNPGIWCWNLHFHLQFWTPTRRLHKFVVNLLLRSKWQVFTGEMSPTEGDSTNHGREKKATLGSKDYNWSTNRCWDGTKSAGIYPHKKWLTTTHHRHYQQETHEKPRFNKFNSEPAGHRWSPGHRSAWQRSRSVHCWRTSATGSSRSRELTGKPQKMGARRTSNII